MTTTQLRLPDSLPYPITITSILAKPNAPLTRGTPLIHYAFDFIQKRPPPPGSSSKTPAISSERRIGTWESPIDGAVVDSWALHPNMVVTARDARSKHALTVTEECSHPVQISGLCAICGKDTTASDYIGISDEARASIRMTHDAAGPTVSQAEAQRIENETAKRLLDSRRLILLVDLDQTIIHATVDPTVGEWIAQGQAYEELVAAHASKKKSRRDKSKSKADDPNGNGDDDDADSSSSDDDDEPTGLADVNPNWKTLKDVFRFKLGPDLPSLPHGKRRPPEIRDDGCDYYIKPRPGLNAFLSKLKDKYEMHVYTMGTRAYALKVCNAIDPNGDFFNQRILTRDESGSMTQKSIERLFPYNSRMVVIIDDRADVWQYSPNLVKVIPYDFFVGIGDINATYLPKQSDPLSAGSPSPTLSVVSSPTTVVATDSATPSLSSSPHTASPPPTSTDASVTQEEVQEVVVAEAQTKAVVSQLEERPLAKMQEALDATEDAKEDAENVPKNGDSHASNGQPNGTSLKPVQHHKALLKNDDWELERVSSILDAVHSRFYQAHDEVGTSYNPDLKGKQRGSLSRSALVPDVQVIIPSLKAQTLAGVHILFSGVIPLQTPPERSEAWRYAHDFGAKCHTRLTNDVTHVVSAKEGTHKALEAFRRGTVKVVWAKWFQDCIALWKHLEETGDYLLPRPSDRTLAEEAEVSAAAPASPSSSFDGRNDDPDYSNGKPGLEVPADSGNGTTTGTDTPLTGTPRMQPLDLDGFDWAAAADDVDAFLNESDDDVEEGEPGPSDGVDPREGIGNDFNDQEMEAMFAEDDEDIANSYEQSSLEPSSSDNGLKRRRSGTPNSVAAPEANDGTSTPNAKRTKFAGKSLPATEEGDSDSDDSDSDEDEEMASPSKRASSVSSAGDDEDDEEVQEGAEAVAENTEEESDDEDFLSGLNDEDGWG